MLRQPHAEDIAALLMFFGFEGRQLWEYVKENETHLSVVRRHASFVNFFDAGFSLSVKQLTQLVRTRTFELPSDFDDVWEWHTGSKVETNKFNNQPLDSQQPLSILFDNLS
jgi:hypothetical protein